MDKTKAKTLLALVVSLALTAFSALAFIDNVSVVVRWRAAFLASGGDAEALAAKIPGILPWFDWAVVDYSCVSTFIPFFGFLLFTVALLRVLSGQKRPTANFPFFASCDQINISLGLIGTLWGIIMIGFYDMETVSMASLISCLHTALFSTLVAVVWVYLVAHPILEPFARGLLLDAGLADDDDDRGLEEILGEIRLAASGVGAALLEQRESLAAFSEGLAETGRKLAALADAADARADGIDLRGRKAADAFAGLLASLEKAHAATIEAMEKARRTSDEALAAAFEKRLAAMDEADAERRRAFAADLLASLDNFRKTVAEGERHFGETLSRRLEEFDKTITERERKFDDILGRRLAKLEAEASASAERATRAESTLSRIKDALG